jgi:hypothetical protein
MKRSTEAAGCLARRCAVAACAAVVLVPTPPAACHRGGVPSVKIDQARMRGSVRIEVAASHAVHEIQLPGGTRVREYVSPAGTVFGVTWRGPFRPDLQQLLGPYFDEFQEAAQAARHKAGGRAPIVIVRPGLVVELGGRPHAFFGRAYVPGLLPAGVSADELE